MEQLPDKKTISYKALMARIILNIMLISILIFLSAGTLNYWQGWLVVGFYLVFTVITSKKFIKRKELVQERIKPGPGIKWWDKIIFRIFVPLTTITMFFSALDCGRFYFSPELPIFVYVISFISMVASYCFITWAMFTNNFFSSRVRIQSDRGQYVVQRGPYKYVRHPGYLGVVFWMPSTAITLGSLWGLIPAGLAVFTIIIRTYLEDKTLQKELPGYSEYAQKVRYRLIPMIW
ncbi:MAG: isoprenylcysteine carboxylmethyltransferase family protein [Phycisphaerales bacterium]